MAKKIVDETLKFSIVINGDAAQKEYGNLSRANKKLEQERIDLESQAKKLKKTEGELSDAYKNAVADLDKNTKAIAANEKTMHALTEEIGINKLTQIQLGKVSKNLTTQLRGMSQEADPKEYARLSKELQSVKARQSELGKEMYGTSKAMGQQTGFLNKLKSGFKEIVFPVSGAILFADALKTGIRFAKDFIKESVQLAIESKGVEVAFKALGDEGESAFLRVKASTRGLLSDLEIKRSLVEFNNFNISLEETDTLFEFLALRATQTGQSVDKLKASLVEGLSKESKLRIDNLGISTAALNAELEKTPDFVQAVANIAKSEISKAGTILDDAASSTQKWEATLENAKLKIGNLVNDSGAISFFQKIGISILGAVTPTESLTKQFQDQQSAFLDLQATLPPLIDEYETLKGKANLTADEQERLKNIITQIGEITPGAITQFDEYGNAMDISAAKAKDFIETQKALLSFQNKDALAETKKQLEDYQKQLDAKQYGLNFNTNRASSSDSDEAIRAKNVKNLSIEVANLKKLEAGALETLDQLSGDYLTKAIERQKLKTAEVLAGLQKEAEALNISIENKTAAELKAEIAKKTSPQTDAQKKASDKATAEAEKRKQEIEANEKAVTEFLKAEKEQRELDALNGFEKEKQQISNKYQVLIDKEIENGQLRKDLIIARDAEIAQAKIDSEIALAERLKVLDEERYIAEQDLKLERELAEAETQIEKDALILEHDYNLAQQKLQIEQDFAIQKLELEGATTAEINAIKERFRLQDEQQDLKYAEGKKKIAKDTAEFKKKQFEDELSMAANASGQLAQILGEETTAGKAFASVQALINTYLGASQVIADPKTPVFLKPFLVASTIGLGLKQVAEINKAKVEGFESGLYPVTRAQDGKRYNAGMSGSQTQIANNPTILVGERPEMIIDPTTYSRMDPSVVDYILQLAGKRPMQGYESGSYKQTESAAEPTTNNQQPTTNHQVSTMAVDAINRLNTILDAGIDIKFGIYQELERQKLQKKLENTLNAAKN